MRQKLRDYFDEIEKTISDIEINRMGEDIRKILNDGLDKEEKDETAERIAFAFMPGEVKEKSSWGGYYRPQFAAKNDQDELWEYPSIKEVSQDIIEYWKSRFEQAKHPILKYTYGNLVFDFEPLVTNKKASYLMVKQVIDACITICEQKLDKDIYCKKRLQRCLQIALSYKNVVLVQKLKDVLIQFERDTASTHKGLWGYSFKWLLIENDGKIEISESEEEGLLRDLEKRLVGLSSIHDPDPFAIEHAVKLLAEYYSQKSDEENLIKVLLALENAFRKNKRANSSGILLVHYLELLVKLYKQYSHFASARQGQLRIIGEMGNLGDRAKEGMKEISISVPFPKKDIEKFLYDMFDRGNPTLEQVIDRIAIHCIIPVDMVRNGLDAQAKAAPLSYFFTQTLMSSNGHTIAKLKPLGEDYENHLKRQYSQYLTFSYTFLSYTLDELKKRYTSAEVAATIMKSPIFEDKQAKTVAKIIEGFWVGEHYAVCSQLIPLIEESVRNTYRLVGEPYMKENKIDGFDYESLGALLKQDVFAEVFQKHGKNIQYYFQILFVERLGWNLRNNFAHGIDSDTFHRPQASSRLIHALFCFAILKPVEHKV